MYCAYRDCLNVALPFSKISFFSLPTDSRRKIWIENSGNEALRDISAKTKKVFCETHFDANSMRKQFMRTTLRKDAVPLKYVPSQEAEHDTTTLTEIYEDDVGDETKLNCARHSPIASSEQAQYVYLLDEEKQESTEQFALLDYSDPIVINDEDENVDSSNAMAQRKISHQPQDEWDLIDGENDDDLNSPVDSQHETESVPNKRRRSGSSGQFSEQVLSSTMRQSNETATLTNPAINYQTESVTKNIAQAISKEVTELPRTTAHPAIESHDEETLFALSLVGTLKRLPPQKLAVAKCHILTYLMQLEYGDVNAKLS